MDQVRMAVAGCGSVSEHYLVHLRECPFVKVVGVCDVIESRFRDRMAEFDVPRGFRGVEAMLAELDFDLLLNLTSMPAHYPINRQALRAGKHVYSEKPFAHAYADGKELLDLAAEKGVRLWGAPNVVTSPQFRFMAAALADGKIGKVHAAHACYGHSGPSWGPWFYKEGGGCVHDLAVYNLTFLTGLLGPAKAVIALEGIAVPERTIERETVTVSAEDNAMILLDHGDAVFSHVQTGFVYRTPNEDRTIELIGTRGSMNLLGWDWAPRGVQIRLECEASWQERCVSPQDYKWQTGAAYAAECLVTGRQSAMVPEHALHVVEIMAATHESARSGRRIPIVSTFPWPLTSATTG